MVLEIREATHQRESGEGEGEWRDSGELEWRDSKESEWRGSLWAGGVRFKSRIPLHFHLCRIVSVGRLYSKLI